MPVPPLVMEMQTGSTNNHIPRIFFVFAAPMYWWDWLAASILMVRYKGDCHVSSTSPNRRPCCVGVPALDGVMLLLASLILASSLQQNGVLTNHTLSLNILDYRTIGIELSNYRSSAIALSNERKVCSLLVCTYSCFPGLR